MRWVAWLAAAITPWWFAGDALAIDTGVVKRVVNRAQATFQDRYTPPGMAVVVVAPEGDRLRTHIFTYGSRDAERPRARVRPSTLFEIGSVTKVFTSALLTDAALRGIVTRTQPAQSLMPPGFTLPTRTLPTEQDPDGIECGGNGMTLQQLAAHTAGFDKKVPGFDSQTKRETLTAEQLFAEVQPMRLLFCPGDGSHYSNIGVGLLGTLLALKQNATYGELIADRITKPLSMNSTRLEANRSRLSAGHCLDNTSAQRWNNIGALAGAGGLMSTITDLGKFIRGHLGEGEASTVAALADTRIQLGPVRAIGWLFKDAPGLAGKYYMKNGATKGFSAAVAVAPEERYGVAILVNRTKTAPDQLGVEITERLLEVEFDLGADNDEEGCSTEP